jgi:protein-tyrosine phosphatase
MMIQPIPGRSAKDHTGASSRDWPCGFVDIHCHCLPDLDDGPESMAEAIRLCSALADDGIELIVATPHQLGRYEARTRADVIRAAVEELNQRIADEGIAVAVLPGGEVRLDERIGALVATHEIVTVADRGRHVLLELPPDVFIDIEPLLRQLRSRGIGLVIAHPERNAALMRHGRILERWVEWGVSLQVTAASLIGYLGTTASDAAWDMVGNGWATLVATDAHDTGPDGPCMRTAFELLVSTLGAEVARRLCMENPRRIVCGADSLPVRSLRRQEVG